MPVERRAPIDPLEWLKRAKSSLAQARAGITIPEIYLEDLCFDAQQAAEKSIKAILIDLKVPFPYVHDLAALLSLVEHQGVALPDAVRETVRLTRFAVASRYPGPQEPVTREEYENAVMIAETVVRWAEEQICERR